VHKLESEARVVASGRVLMVIEKVGLEVFFVKVFTRHAIFGLSLLLVNGELCQSG